MDELSGGFARQGAKTREILRKPGSPARSFASNGRWLEKGIGILGDLLAVLCRYGVDLSVSAKLDGLVTMLALGDEDFYGFSD